MILKMLKKDLIKTVVLSVVASAIVLTAFFELKEFKEEEDVKEVRNRVLQVNSSDVVSFKLSPENINLIRSGNNWKITSPIQDVVPTAYVEDWLSGLLSLDGRVLGTDKDKDLLWSDFGFISNSRSVTYTTKNGDKPVVVISDKEAFDGSTYLKVKPEVGAESLLITSSIDWKDKTIRKPYDFRSKKLFNWSELSSEGTPVMFKVSNPSEKQYYELNLKDGEWRAKRRSRWSIDEEALKAYFQKLKSEDIIAFLDPEKYKKAKKELSFNIALSTGEKISLDILKEKYTTFARVSYRPDVVFKISNKAIKNLYISLLGLKSKNDFYYFDTEKVKSFLFKKGDKSYRIKNEKDTWVLKNKSATPKGKDFNESKVFEMFDLLKKLGGVRYVKANTLFYTSKKRLTLYNRVNNMYYQLEVGQKFPTKFGSRRTDGYLMRSTSSSQLLVVDRKKVDELFKINFFKKEVAEVKKDVVKAKKEKLTTNEVKK